MTKLNDILRKIQDYVGDLVQSLRDAVAEFLHDRPRIQEVVEKYAPDMTTSAGRRPVFALAAFATGAMLATSLAGALAIGVTFAFIEMAITAYQDMTADNFREALTMYCVMNTANACVSVGLGACGLVLACILEAFIVESVLKTLQGYAYNDGWRLGVSLGEEDRERDFAGSVN